MEEDMKGTMYGRIPAVLLQGVTQSLVPQSLVTVLHRGLASAHV